MQKITIGEQDFSLNIGSEITVKELRKVYPIFQKSSEIGEMEMVIQIFSLLSDDASVIEKIDGLNLEQFTELATWLGNVIEVKKK